MIKKITTSLSKPPLVLFFIKDAWKHTFLYILCLPILLVIPSIILTYTQSPMTTELYNQVKTVVARDFRSDDIKLENYILTYDEAISSSVGVFDLSVGEYKESLAINFVLEEQGISIYVFDQKINSYTYESLGVETLDFSSTESKDIQSLTLLIKEVYEQQTYMIISNHIVTYLLYLFDFVTIVLIMSLLSKIMLPRGMKIPYKIHLKLSAYLSTIYVFSNLVFILLDVNTWSFVSITLVYIYHLWAFKSIKILPKGVQ